MNGTEWKEQHAPNLVLKQWQEAIAAWVQVKGLPPLSQEELMMDLTFDVGQIMLMFRKGKLETFWGTHGEPKGYPAEMAQLFVSLLHLATTANVDLSKEVASVMEFNYSRAARVVHPTPEQPSRKEDNMEPVGTGTGTIEEVKTEAPKAPAMPPPPQGADLNAWCKYVNDWAQSKGWNDSPLHIGDALMLMVTELAEAKEEDRKRPNQPNSYHYEDTDKGPKLCGLPSELADAVIRIFHFCGRAGINLEQVICEKMVYNQKRAYRHGGLAS